MPARPRGAPVLRLAAWAPMALAMRQAAVMFISPATRGALGPQGGRRCRRGAPLLARRASGLALEVDPEYPGTAVQRLRNIQDRVRSLSRGDLDGDWEEVRRKLLWAGGLRDLPDAQPGRGYTGHAFNDHNHCDLTAMLGDVSHNENDGSVDQIAVGNLLGPGIEVASLPELGPGGSWSTCTNGCHTDPPRDVAHVQFRSRIAFKLVWCPPDFESFVLVDDAGGLLARGRPGGALPQEGLRAANYALVRGSKYAKEAEAAVE
ncbi:unnamed protein product [Prorocentrum cordatum]|uniref:Uncharacterized protein n=1 Tax=Prorocentrum cordatum TaxID=2364126 RepID=A0ABN9S700_9DINO|nr:unnamed protein product [Polarella glacialis]